MCSVQSVVLNMQGAAYSGQCVVCKLQCDVRSLHMECEVLRMKSEI